MLIKICIDFDFDVQVKNRAFLRFSVCRHSPDFKKKKISFLNSHKILRNDEIDKVKDIIVSTNLKDLE